MGKYQAYDSKVEVAGQFMLALVQCIGAEQVTPILQRRNIDIQPDAWYSQQEWLDILSEIEEELKDNLLFVSVGMKLMDLTPLPEGITLEQLMMSLDDSYQNTHRGGKAGHLETRKIADKQFAVTVTTPYPIELDYGVEYALCKRFLPEGTKFTVKYADGAKLDEPGATITIHVSWE